MSEPNTDMSRRIERSHWHLWLVSSALVFSLAVTVYILYQRLSFDLHDTTEPPLWVQSGYTAGIALVGLVCVFILYTLVQHRELKHLRGRISGEERELEDLRARLGEITHLFEVATELNLRLPVETILSIMVRRVVSALKAQQASVMLFSDDSQVLETRAYYGVEGEFTALGRLRLGEGIAGKVAAAKEPLLLDGETRNPEITQHFKPYRNITSALSIPLVVENSCVGVLNVNRINHPQLFNDQQKEIVRLFAQNIAGVIRRAAEQEQLAERNRELATANEMLREMNRMKDVFLSTASHELKTPLTSVIGYAELLNDHESDLAPDQRKEFTRRLRSEAGQLLGLIEDILDLTRLETGKIELKPARVSFSQLARSAVETVRPAAEKAGVRLAEAYEADEDYGLLDEVKVRQALVNLIVNAVKFSPSQGEVQIHTRREDDSLLAEIADQGPGVAQEESSAIFALFGQGIRPRTKGSTGLGIGLHLVKRIVEMHGGTVGVRSRPGGGSVFWIRLPREIPASRPLAA